MFFFQEGFTYRNFLVDAITIFVFIVWFWLEPISKFPTAVDPL